MAVLVETNNLTKWYGKHKVINSLNLSVKKGEIYGLIGRNGAGKTTILRLISGFTKPTEGNIRLFEKNDHDTIYVQSRIGVLIELKIREFTRI